ncbi:sensor histidine kinase [Sphingomonas oleivorans]|nr:HAMP domain-containing sensor histidine kinase [Sphingomonas oleivorans]
MLAMAAHDLLQPLHLMLRAVEELEPCCSDRPHLRCWLDLAKEQGARLATGLRNLMLTNERRLGAARTAPPTPFSLASMFDELEADWAPFAVANGLRFSVVRTSAMIISDRSLLRAVLGNLIGNAIKFTATGGIVLGVRRRGHVIRIDVVDTGCGIDADDQQRIFDPFYQSEPDRRGAGLGLAFVRSACRELDYGVECRSVAGVGSRFSICVPILPLAGPGMIRIAAGG